ncbi:hypothetical protein BU26DRAFT_519180 [Trematosphaeria pertusa]|uniref:Uncharacterized protein n=1 Tax=Trematosphaeria pertusa TaxID=390896 RepID=A0A6A6IEK8_9PLEO|nr:uncharacterized protein BU26DRAFT_519180 [Trematosphaeria pertusa]KAF2249014.1 hypothetical protein BU26DRAFT_519180 [Trematosphaeria pertusa]
MPSLLPFAPLHHFLSLAPCDPTLPSPQPNLLKHRSQNRNSRCPAPSAEVIRAAPFPQPLRPLAPISERYQVCTLAFAVNSLLSTCNIYTVLLLLTWSAAARVPEAASAFLHQTPAKPGPQTKHQP